MNAQQPLDLADQRSISNQEIAIGNHNKALTTARGYRDMRLQLMASRYRNRRNIMERGLYPYMYAMQLAGRDGYINIIA